MSIHLPQLQHPKGMLTTQDISCITDNVVYCLTCIKCPSIVYSGETGRGLADRFREHRRDVINGKNDLPLPTFFNQANHYRWFLGVADTNDVIQKIEKTLNNTHTTTQKLTNNSFRNTKKHPHYHTLKDMKVAVLKAGLANQDYCKKQEKCLISHVELYGSEWP